MMKALRKLYDWVLHWADTPYGAPALFILSFMESSFFPIPPDPLLIALVLGGRDKAFRFAANCTTGSVLGAVFGYAIGYYVWWSGPDKFSAVAWFFFHHVPGFSVELFRYIQALFEKWNFWIIFTAGFTPIPYKVFTVSGGAFNVNLPMFLIASIVSRGARFFLVAFLIWKFGPQIKSFIDRYFNWLAILFTILLIGGFIVVKWWGSQL
ncbi:MAG TPA: YqaA family protein [Syntrophales bacterium]|jgi:membrane protein YqaA with SNARE-associated domain|nr:YqaA family protein [Syntrophales bacterium]HON23346.1 YqaA family protein [Syntrophales bacterium]HOU78313.1 YqaA family protein [Syntrophales bacterium]HPC31785.1 YqaA family protein [Syntrophales bacterium]HQG33524.1 YqaA family protein [Syntrophales bacterium]